MGTPQIFGGEPVLQFRSNVDRRNFLKWAGLVGVGASFVAGGVLGVPTAAEAAEIKTGIKASTDLDILNYALTLEYLEADFYAQSLAKNVFDGRALEIVTAIGDHENQHVAAVTNTITQLGGTPVAKPKITYPAGLFDSMNTWLVNASQFEELGVTAYHGQVPLIQSPDVLGAAASIAGVESRHAAVIAWMLDANPFPNPIEKNASMETVLAAVKPLIS